MRTAAMEGHKRPGDATCRGDSWVERGYEVLVSFADTETQPGHAIVCVARMQDSQVEGIAVLTFGIEEYLRDHPIDVPLVHSGSDRDLPQARNVRVNYLPGLRDAVKHLADYGHTRIGYISGQLRFNSMKTRYKAVRKAISAASVDLDKGLVAERPYLERWRLEAAINFG